MTTATSDCGVWPTVRYRDAEAGLAWQTAIGLIELAVHRDDEPASKTVHAELVWPASGGIMMGTHEGTNAQWPQPPGTAALYLVTEDTAGLHSAALAAGGTELSPVIDHDYGGSGGSVRDPEGNLWSFGSYRPADPDQDR